MVAARNKDTGEWLSFPDFNVVDKPDWDDMDIPDDQLRELVEWKTDGRIPACDVEAVYARIITEDELKDIRHKSFKRGYFDGYADAERGEAKQPTYWWNRRKEETK